MLPTPSLHNGVASDSKIDKIISLFCKRALRQRLYSAKETYNFIDPTNRRHPVHDLGEAPSSVWCVYLFHELCGVYMCVTNSIFALHDLGEAPSSVWCVFLCHELCGVYMCVTNSIFALHDLGEAPSSVWCVFLCHELCGVYMCVTNSIFAIHDFFSSCS